MVRVTRKELPFARNIKQANQLSDEDRVKIAIQGERGSFSHQAALQFRADAEVVPCKQAREVFRLVLERAADALAIPVENTLAGAIVEHYDLLREHAVAIAGETVVRIEHHVIGAPGATIADLRRVYSHPVALAQCRSFFREHPQIEATGFYDTAGAVEHIVREGDRQAGAIAGRPAATLYGGQLLAEGVEDDPANYTRFVLARSGSAAEPPSGAHKMSLCVELDPGPGSLLELLRAVAELGGNLTQLQPRPVLGQPWQYYFFLDALLPHGAAAQRFLEQLPALSVAHQVLGRYAAAPEFLEDERRAGERTQFGR
jgi:prephenate dehydratase